MVFEVILHSVVLDQGVVHFKQEHNFFGAMSFGRLLGAMPAVIARNDSASLRLSPGVFFVLYFSFNTASLVPPGTHCVVNPNRLKTLSML